MRSLRVLAVPAAAFAAALALALAATFARGGWAGWGWGRAHADLAVLGALVPAYLAFLQHAWARFFPGEPPGRRLERAIAFLVAGAAGLAAAHLLRPEWDTRVLGVVAGLVVAAGGVLAVPAVLPRLPARGATLVRAEEPLTKGDDACAKQLRFSMFFLPLGLALLAAAEWPTGAWQARLRGAGVHVLLAGHALLAVYATSHLWVPRFSGVPAIAAGAIKGELHSTLGGVTFLLAGFLTRGVWGGSTGLLVAGGGFLFLGVFTFMGVLGANIMKNKSRTQRVTPEFSYIPWMFAGVFWLLSGILLGLFLNAVPEPLEHLAPSLRLVHLHAALFGGAAQVLVALLVRALPMEAGAGPPPFGRSRLAFLGWNAGLAAMVVGALGAGTGGAAFAAGSVVAALSAVAALKTLAPARRP